jgi:hypothetical protein
MTTSIQAAVLRRYREFETAREEVRAAGLHLPLALDSASAIYANALRDLGLPAADREILLQAGVAAQRTVFRSTVSSKDGRRAIAQDAGLSDANVAAFTKRFPKARLSRSLGYGRARGD